MRILDAFFQKLAGQLSNIFKMYCRKITCFANKSKGKVLSYADLRKIMQYLHNKLKKTNHFRNHRQSNISLAHRGKI